VGYLGYVANDDINKRMDVPLGPLAPGFWEHTREEEARSIHAQRANQGQYPVDALLPSSQHREGGSPRGELCDGCIEVNRGGRHV
jgi:hypothetical protein